ncbi:MAG: winged helix-turn-helix domain-containing protein [Candidatus Woesearchaeota archaeon]
MVVSIRIIRYIFVYWLWLWEKEKMELETLFTTSKWIILKILSEGPKSPLELSKLSRTSLANISQQLRLLELGGFVERKRIPNRDKGQPRILYSLKGNHAFIIVGMNDFADKKAINLSARQKATLRIWFLENTEIHYFIEKILWNLDDELENIQAIQYNLNSIIDIDMKIVTDNNNLKKKLNDYIITNGPITKKVKFSYIKEISREYYTIYVQEKKQKEKNIRSEVNL